MNEISVLVVVNVEGALAANTLQGYLFMIDTNGYFGSTNEGTSELTTACTDQQIINWTAQSVDPDSSLSIVSFSGAMIANNVCNPRQINGLNGPYWEGRVNLGNNNTSEQYSMTLSLNGTQMSFDPFLKITAIPS